MKATLRLAFVLMTATDYFGLNAAQAATPPINCKKASTTIEKTICESPEFVAMDREIAALYDRGLAAFSIDDRHRLAAGQLAFIKQRGGCAWASHHSAHPGPAINECIRDKMETRLRSLRTSVDRGGIAGR
jgi:uncharacterized protein